MWSRRKSGSSGSAKYELLGGQTSGRSSGQQRRCLYVLWFTAAASGLYLLSLNFVPQLTIERSHPASPVTSRLLPEFESLLTSANSTPFILLEPHILFQLTGYSDEQFEDFRWRFNLPAEHFGRRNSLTVGIFAGDFSEHHILLSNFTEKHRVSGPYGPFNASGTVAQHVFYETTNSSIGAPLHLHLVVLFPVRHFFWIGAIPEADQFTLQDNNEHNPNHSYTLHYGLHEEIYDPFNVTTVEGLQLPDDVAHFLSQRPTSRYLHCNPEKTTQWFKESNQTINKNKVEASEMAFVRTKSLMRAMKMEFWMACGTLLGWYRQCQITPYTTDTDFASWSKYVRARDLTATLQVEARRHSLYLLNRFGERMHSLEYSFATTGKWEKVDLFFIYQNQTHYLLPFHVMPQFAYSIYPRYYLCSGELLGYKLLVPCDPEKIIITEYGPNWRKPVSSWNYYTAPRNIGPLKAFKFNVTQHETFSQ